MEEVTVAHMKGVAYCAHPDISITRSLQSLLECSGKRMTPAERTSATESLRVREDVMHDGMRIWRA
jgi:hypothetical protein